jgi:hypothetical protein
VERLTCISCGTYITVGSGAVKFPCPECGEVLGRCTRCRELGKKYLCKCGFKGP